MTHLETLIMNIIREELEKLQWSGVGYIDSEEINDIKYKIDGNLIVVTVVEPHGVIGP